MARSVYGFAGGDLIAAKVADADAVGGFVYAPSAAVFDAMTTRTGSTQHTDLLTIAGGAITTVTPDSDGRIMFQGLDAYKDTYWLRNQAAPSAARWRVDPVDVPARVTAVEAAIGGGGSVSLGTVDAKGDLIAGTANDTVDNLTVGANNTVLTADSTQTTGLRWGSAPIPVSIIDAEGDLIVGSAADTAVRLPKGTALQYLRRNSANTANEWGALPAVAAAPAFDGLSDVSATSPADGALARFETSDNLWHATDATSLFAGVGGDGRLAAADWPQGLIPAAIINAGGALPSYITTGNLVFVRSAVAATLAVDTVGTGNNAATPSTSVTATNSLSYATGDYAVVCVSVSAEATFPTSITCTGPTNIGAMTAAANITQGTTAASYIFYARATGAVATSQTFTVTAAGGTASRSDWAIRVLRLQGLVSSAVIDLTATGGGAGQTTFSVATAGPTAQASEVAIASFSYNPTIAGTFTPTGGWVQIGTPVANTDAAPRGVAVVYKILTASAIQAASATVTNPTTWAGALATFKGV